MGTKKKDPADLVTIPFDKLVLEHREIGVHRGRKYGFRDVFGFKTLLDQPFTKLAKKVKAAYEGSDVPSHKGWPKQQETLKWFVDQGAEAMYQFKDDILVYKRHDGIYGLAEGNHRSLALYIMGSDSIRAAVVKRASPRWSRVSFG
jgi:hypothetical protein